MHHAKCLHVRSLTAHKVTEDTCEVVIVCLLSCNVTGGSSNLRCLKIDKPALRKSDHEADAVIYERCLTRGYSVCLSVWLHTCNTVCMVQVLPAECDDLYSEGNVRYQWLWCRTAGFPYSCAHVWIRAWCSFTWVLIFTYPFLLPVLQLPLSCHQWPCS